MNHISFKAILTVFIFSLLFSCKSDEKDANLKHDTTKVVEIENPLVLKISDVKEKYIIGDDVRISIQGSKIDLNDTIVLFINNQKQAVFFINSHEYTWKTVSAKTGQNKIEVELNKTGKKFRKQINILFLSDIVPENYTYKIKKVYKHDVHAYTQGLFFHDGFLYEATGLKGESTVRKVKPETGEIIHSFAIPKDVFGEGIVLFDGKIVQLSWESGRGFVYDFESFKLIDEFSYFGEGWGICADETNLYMSNGSEEIKILEPQSYSEIDKLQVYDNKGPVKYLNELEYIKGAIFANIYQYEKIVKIDPTSGKVLAYIDLKGILPMNDYTNKTDVLNGIAYDSDLDRLFVTGKKWPKLFEIELIKK